MDKTSQLLAIGASAAAVTVVLNLYFKWLDRSSAPDGSVPPPPMALYRKRRRRKQSDYDDELSPGSSDLEDLRAERRIRGAAGRRPRGMTYNKSFDKDMLGEPESVGGVWCGFSMEEALNHAEEGHSQAMARTPKQVLADLQKGNARFWMGAATRPEKSAFERRALITKQFPSVAILGCSDSRVPVEIVFDQGLGDVFVIRVAGNCLDVSTLASLQYAVHHLKIKVLMVMGHEGCGAVKAALTADLSGGDNPEELTRLLKGLKSGLDGSRLANVFDARARDRESVVTNVKAQVGKLGNDDCIMKKIRTDELIVVGAFYELSSGIVDFFFELTEDIMDEKKEADVSSSAQPALPVVSRTNLPGVQSRLTIKTPRSTSPKFMYGRSKTDILAPSDGESEEESEEPSRRKSQQLLSDQRSSETDQSKKRQLKPAKSEPANPASVARN